MTTETFSDHNMVIKLIQDELIDTDSWKSLRDWGISIDVSHDNLTFLKGNISGPLDTPYKGGNFHFEMNVPDKYPLFAPDVRVITKIWHPNICSVSGATSLFNNWSASMTLEKIFVSLQALLSVADLEHTIDEVVTQQYKEDPDMFRLTAKYWAQVYAGAPGSNSDFDIKIAHLIDMGADESTACKILSSCSWDLENATKNLNFIFS